MTDDEITEFLETHAKFGKVLDSLVKTLLDKSQVKYHQVESRTKTFKSVKEKLIRNNIQDLKEEMTDLSGIRIILFYTADIKKIEKIITDNFTIDKPNSVDKASLMASNEFGYLSVHYVAKLKNDRASLTEYKEFANLNIEFQVRTILQHSWASIAHEISYKKQRDLPPQLDRKLFRLAGLFELIDEQFEVIKAEDNSILEQYEEISDNASFLRKPITFLSIETMFKNNLIEHSNLLKAAKREGVLLLEDAKISNESISEILYLAKIIGINTNNDLNMKISEAIPRTKKMLKNMVNQVRTWKATSYFITILALITYLEPNQMEKYRQEFSWNDNVWNYIKKAKIASY